MVDGELLPAVGVDVGGETGGDVGWINSRVGISEGIGVGLADSEDRLQPAIRLARRMTIKTLFELIYSSNKVGLSIVKTGQMRMNIDVIYR